MYDFRMQCDPSDPENLWTYRMSKFTVLNYSQSLYSCRDVGQAVTSPSLSEHSGHICQNIWFLVFYNMCLKSSISGDVWLVSHVCFQPCEFKTVIPTSLEVNDVSPKAYSSNKASASCVGVLWQPHYLSLSVYTQSKWKVTAGIIVCSCLCVLLHALFTLSRGAATFLQCVLSEVWNLTFTVGVWGFVGISIIVLWFCQGH